jgi:hypothetical protein
MQSNADDLATVARVRRAMPRNSDVMRICEIAEEAITVRRIVQATELVAVTKFDKKAYQREYMRKRRAKAGR